MSLYVPDIRSEKPEVRSGHICLTFRGNIFIWGGFNDNDDADEDIGRNNYISSESLWIYNINTCTWKQVLCSGDLPEGLSGACASRIGKTLYVFAGHCKEFGHSYNLYSLDLLKYTWKAHSFNSKLPMPRDKFGSWVMDNRIIYFGGYSTEPYRRRPHHGPFVGHQNHLGWTGQVAVLHTNQENDVVEWKYPTCKGDPPYPRAAHGMTRIGSKGYLFGGRHSVCRDNDLHYLDLESLTWSGRLHVTGPEPCGRSWHVFVTCGPQHILLHGGFDQNNKELGDAWLLNVHSLTWIEIDAFKQMSPPRTRLWHSACQTDNEGQIAIFGGCSGSLFETHSHHTNDLVFFHFSPQRLQRLCEDAVVRSRGKLALYIDTLPKHISRNLRVPLYRSKKYKEIHYVTLRQAQSGKKT